MKRGYYLLVILLSSFSNIFSQGRDNYWPLGYASYTTDTLVGGITMDFWNGIRNFYDHPREMNYEFSNSSICNISGNLLFYTNGVYIANALEDTMLNGGGLNPSFYTSQFYQYGLRIPQPNIILPKPGSDSLYYLFHETVDISAPNCYCPIIFYYSEINMQGDSGRGEVIKKNQVILQDSLSAGAITACKHANGRDWWVVATEHGTELGAYIILVTPDTIMVYNHQSMHSDGTGSTQACFSPDGSKYLITNNNGVSFYDFDRCNGTMTFLDSVVYIDNTFLFTWGVSVSPNSRYAYLSRSIDFYQFDLQAPDISSSQVLVAQWDSFADPISWGTIFWMHQIAPDGKIYVSTGCTMGYHIIDEPDSGGMACNFQQHAIHFPHFNCAIPNFPNYNLGRLVGSPCDTLQWVGVQEHVNDFRFSVFPNPNNGNFKIKYQLPQNKNGTLQIIDVTGKVVYKQNLPQWSTMQNISLPQLAEGVYNCVITSDGMRVSKKVVVIKE